MNPAGAPELARFDGTQRTLHWLVAVLGLVLAATGLAMYFGPLSQIVGRRGTVREIHVIAGLALPAPLLVAFLLPRRGTALRADARRVNRFDADDKMWLNPRRHRDARPGKFNAGQKLNAVFLSAAFVVLFATGVVLHWATRFAVDTRTGATFVHDWFAIGVWLALAGHLYFALSDPQALRGMVRGRVSAAWARRTHPRWAAEIDGDAPDSVEHRENPRSSTGAPR